MKCNDCDHLNLEDMLFALRRNIFKHVKGGPKTGDLTFSQVEVMHLIQKSGKETMKGLANRLKITPPSVTELISDLEKKGLVKRINDQNDRRVVHITPTIAAKKIFQAALKQKDLIFKKFFDKLNDRDKKTLKRIIKILITE